MTESTERKQENTYSAFQIKPPEQFDFGKPEEFPAWKKRYDRYHNLSHLNQSDDADQIDYLCYIMGPKAEEILASFKLNEAEKKNYSVVSKKFEEYFFPKRNVIYERSVFNRRIQQPGESVTEFVTALHKLSETCDYGPLTDELIRDRIVVGVSDSSVSYKLQLQADLTLETATQLARQAESVKKQQSEMNPSHQSKEVNIDTVNRYRPLSSSSRNPNTSNTRGKLTSFQPNLNKGKQENCWWCGRVRDHSRRDCPARDATCHQCLLKGHFAQVCQKKEKQRNIHSIENACNDTSTVDQDNGCFFGNVINQKPVSENNEYSITLHIGSHNNLCLEIDTGADETILPAEYLDKDFPIQPPPTSPLCAPGNNHLKCAGIQYLPMRYGRLTSYQKVYFIENHRQLLLGKPAIKALGLIKRVNQVHQSEENHQFFEGIGQLPEKYSYRIDLYENSTPVAIATPRRVPLPLLKETKKELDKLQQKGIISRVTEATKWCSPLVVVPKQDGKSVRLCVDLTALNNCVQRRYHPIPKLDHTFAKIKGARVFSKLDANSGFYQINLHPESRPLTTFLTPFGRFWFNRLPFGITSAPEFFQSCMEDILADCPNVACHMDDVLVWGKDQQEHDQALKTVLQKLKSIGMTLNKEKSVFSVSTVRFLGHICSAEGIALDPERVAAIVQMERPTNRTELQSFLGMVTFMNRGLPDRATILTPLYELLKNDAAFHWDQTQEDAFGKIKESIAQAPTLAIYDPARVTKITSDASNFGLGCALLQKQDDDNYRPIAFASRTLSETERRYAPIEKEALGLVWACEKFSDYIIGLPVIIETDHQPLVTIFSEKKDINSLTPRLQRFRIRMMRYNVVVQYLPGKRMITADTLSRKPVGRAIQEEELPDTSTFVNSVISSLPFSDKKLEELKQQQALDKTCEKLICYTQKGWPEKSRVPQELLSFWSFRHTLTVVQGLLLYGSRLYIPPSSRKDMLEKLHSGHFGIGKSRRFAQQAIWWPGLSNEIEDLVKSCKKCVEQQVNHHEPLMPTELPSRPWQKVGADLLKHSGTWYLLVIDYYSRFFELKTLPRQDSKTIEERLKSVFATHGIPETLFTDNQAQMISQTAVAFSEQWGFRVVTRSPEFPQSNGLAEAGVKIAKRVLNAPDPYLALLTYRNTPLELGYSPAQLLFNRRLRTVLPVMPHLLAPQTPQAAEVKAADDRLKLKQKSVYDKTHRTHDLRPLQKGEEVYIKDRGEWGTILAPTPEPRSYNIEIDGRSFRRNRFSLLAPKPVENGENSMENSNSSPVSSPTPRPSSEHSEASSAQGRPQRNKCPPRYLQDYVR